MIRLALMLLTVSILVLQGRGEEPRADRLPGTGAAKVVWVYPFNQRTSAAFPGLGDVLGAVVGTLKDEQRFNLIPFGFATSLKPLAEDRLVEATAENRAWAERFVKRAHPRNGDAEPALGKAFGLEPAEIWLLADDDLGEQIVKRIRELNRRKRVTIHAVALVEKADAPEFVFETQLKQIAEENGGTFRRLGK